MSARIAVGAATALALVALVFGASRPEGGGERDPASSASDEGSGGLSIFAALLAENGHEVRRRGTPSDDPPDPGETAVLLDPGELTAADRDALRAFVAGGGALVLGGDVPAAALEAVSGVQTTTTPGSGAARPLLPVAETAGVGTIEARGERFASVGGALPIAGDESGDLAAITSVGEGRVLLLSDSSPLRNGDIANADNALFAVELAGPPGRPVAFVEGVSLGDFKGATGLAALPDRWSWSALLLLIAALVYVWARFRRLGEPDREGRDLPPPRSRYVEALAEALARTGSATAAGEPVRTEARRRLLAAGGLGAEADADMLAAVGARQGLDPDLARELSEPPADDGAAVRAGTALAKLWR